jgi:hypothetical protein
MSRQWIVVTCSIVLAWSILSLAAAILQKLRRNFIAPTPLITAIGSAAIVGALVYIPPMLGRSISLISAALIWLFMAPWISLAILIVLLANAIARSRKPVGADTKSGLFLHFIVIALIVFNCYWLLEFDAALRE